MTVRKPFHDAIVRSHISFVLDGTYDLSQQNTTVETRVALCERALAGDQDALREVLTYTKVREVEELSTAKNGLPGTDGPPSGALWLATNQAFWQLISAAHRVRGAGCEMDVARAALKYAAAALRESAPDKASEWLERQAWSP